MWDLSDPSWCSMLFFSQNTSYCHFRDSTVCTGVWHAEGMNCQLCETSSLSLSLFPMELNMGKALSAKIFALVCSCCSVLELTRITSWSHWSHVFSRVQAAPCCLCTCVFSGLAVYILKIFNKVLCVQAFAVVSLEPISTSEPKPLKASNSWRKKCLARTLHEMWLTNVAGRGHTSLLKGYFNGNKLNCLSLYFKLWIFKKLMGSAPDSQMLFVFARHIYFPIFTMCNKLFFLRFNTQHFYKRGFTIILH